MSNSITHQEKKKIASQIEQLHSKKHFKHIFKLVYDENNKYTTNDNGIYININAMSDSTLLKIKDFLDSLNKSKTIIPVPKEYVPYYSDNGSDKIFNNGKLYKMSIFDREAKLPVIRKNNGAEEYSDSNSKIETSSLFDNKTKICLETSIFDSCSNNKIAKSLFNQNTESEDINTTNNNIKNIIVKPFNLLMND